MLSCLMGLVPDAAKTRWSHHLVSWLERRAEYYRRRQYQARKGIA